MKEKFEALELDVVRFENEDIIRTSITGVDSCPSKSSSGSCDVDLGFGSGCSEFSR